MGAGVSNIKLMHLYVQFVDPTCHKSHETIQQCIDMMADLTLPDTK